LSNAHLIFIYDQNNIEMQGKAPSSLINRGRSKRKQKSVLSEFSLREPSVLDALRSGKRIEIRDIVYEGFNEVLCIKAGGPEPGVGCAGRGIITQSNS
jgi:nitrogenase subunit NifH